MYSTKTSGHIDHIYLLAKEIAHILKRPIKNKSLKEQKVLFITDWMNEAIYEKIIENRKYKKAYDLGLCFDISSDNLNLLS